MTKRISFLTAFCLMAACADQGLGFGKAPPNEFLILTYPPLTVPPNISLRAPSNPTKKTQLPLTSLAERAIYGGNNQRSKTMSAGERAFAKRIGVSRAQPDIRRLIAADRGLALYPRGITLKIIPKNNRKKQTPKK